MSAVDFSEAFEGLKLKLNREPNRKLSRKPPFQLNSIALVQRAGVPPRHNLPSTGKDGLGLRTILVDVRLTS